MLKPDTPARDAKPLDADTAAPASPLARVMREFEQLVLDFERGLQRSLADPCPAPLAPAYDAHDAHDIRREACRLAISDLSDTYARKHIRCSLHAAEAEGKRVEEQLHQRDRQRNRDRALALDTADDALGIHHGYFRLYSTELFDLLGQPTDLRFGTLRFHKHADNVHNTHPYQVDDAHLDHVDDAHLDRRDDAHPDQVDDTHLNTPGVTVELALSHAFFVADSAETLPYHTFRMPSTPSLQNRGLLSRNPDDAGAFPDFDSWLLFTFLSSACLKLEVPIEMCAHVYGGRLRGRENEEVTFWGFFVDDDMHS
ncbi:hypothetical protein ST47_g7715 [Ascochyta rabiei]|uniref:Uncharacterized protein n=2 Tax=Didymella rabiei TaxID=5454 RepID=A0A163AE54_DIDRA|nr:hypothetical protein ST47_g7715 [Ascochyta rabiei]